MATGIAALVVTVLSYNYSGVPRQILADHEREVTRIYGRIGILVEWVECPLDRQQSNGPPACNSPLGLTNLEIRFLSEPMSERVGMDRAALGSSVQPINGRVPPIRIAWPRVQQAALHYHVTPGVLLGHVVAHELGHVLTRGGGHSSSGLMHGLWTRRDLDWAMQGSLNFSSSEAEAIRSNLLLTRADQLDDARQLDYARGNTK